MNFIPSNAETTYKLWWPGSGRLTHGLMIALLVVHGTLVGLSLSRNAVTIDEFSHLPAGLSYWHHGQFWCYHHNPPLIKLLFSLPAAVTRVPTDYQNYQYTPGERWADHELGKDFMLLNSKKYMNIYVMARSVVVLLSLLGGFVVFRWSRRLFGDVGGLTSLFLWTFCPNILAHAGLVTPDLGATVVSLLASYQFWRYLEDPTMKRAILAGVLLGLAEASKYSSVFLPFVWATLGLIKIWLDCRSTTAPRLGVRGAMIHATVIGFMSIMILNNIYLAEGFGKPLGEFEFRSRLLTKEVISAEPNSPVSTRRENWFRDTILGLLPVPFPEHYVLGFDDQTYDINTANYYKYLRGDLRLGNGWYYYYVYCILVKTPLGTLAIMAVTVITGIVLKRARKDPISELSLLLPLLAVMTLVSSQRGLNSHLRYVLLVFPFAFISAGRLGPLVVESRVRRRILIVALASTAFSAIAIHPHYLTYFNEIAGGPDHGLEHLADSNIDWGQGLISLRDWLSQNAPGRKIKLAYFGRMYPEILDITYELPPFGPDSGVPKSADRQIGPVPGLQAVSGHYLVGFPFTSPNSQGSIDWVPLNSYRYYLRFRPLAIVGHSIFVFDLSEDEVNHVRREIGLPPYRLERLTVPGK